MTINAQQWNIPPAGLQIDRNAVHIWLAHLAQESLAIRNFYTLLSDDEQAQAARFYFERDRNRYIIAHGILRILLARYLGCEPRAVCFRVNDYGKPSLDLPRQEQMLNFNLSHSHELALYAFTNDRDIGVDIEYMRANVDYEQVARVSFTPHEQAALRKLSDAEKQQGFFNCWTRKEAYIKARGMGLSLPLDLFDVSLKPGEPAQLLASREDAREMARWTMRALSPPAGYAGALAVEGNGWDLECYEWQNSAIK